MTPTVAAVDCGTNSTRLLVAEDGAPVERLMGITRLGEGVGRTGRLRPEAVERTTRVLEEYRAVMDRHGVDRVRMTATSAARDATNREEFFAAAEQVVGVRPELLSGHDEAVLSFAGATAELDPGRGPFLVADIGGGSTELAFGADRVEASASLDVGCVRMTEQYLHRDPPGPDELSACLSVLRTHFEEVAREHPEMVDAACLVGLAGTVTTVAAVEIGLATYDPDRLHHFVLEKDAVEDVFRTLATETRAERVHNPGLEEGRADVIVGGTCVLVALMRTLGFDRCLVSEADILDGLAASLVP